MAVISSETVRRGQRLAERQRAHLFELELTGRWRLYFKTEKEFKAKIAAVSEALRNGRSSFPTSLVKKRKPNRPRPRSLATKSLGTKSLGTKSLGTKGLGTSL